MFHHPYGGPRPSGTNFQVCVVPYGAFRLNQIPIRLDCGSLAARLQGSSEIADITAAILQFGVILIEAFLGEVHVVIHLHHVKESLHLRGGVPCIHQSVNGP